MEQFIPSRGPEDPATPATGVRQLVVVGLLEANRKRLHRPAAQPRHDGDDRARVDAAAQESAERHFAHEVEAYCLPELMQKTLDEELFRLATVGLGLDLPVTFQLKLSVVPHRDVCGRKLVDAFVDRVGPWHIAKGKEAGKRRVLPPRQGRRLNRGRRLPALWPRQ